MFGASRGVERRLQRGRERARREEGPPRVRRLRIVSPNTTHGASQRLRGEDVATRRRVALDGVQGVAEPGQKRGLERPDEVERGGELAVMANEIPGRGRGDRRGRIRIRIPRGDMCSGRRVSGRRGDVAALRVGGLRRRPRRQGLAPRHLLAAALTERTLRAARPGPRSASARHEERGASGVSSSGSALVTKRCAQARFERRHARSFFSAGPQSGRSAFLPVWFTTRCVQRENAAAASGHTTRPCTRAGAGAGWGVRDQDARSGGKQRKVRARRTG